jgi:hypothetical protein
MLRKALQQLPIFLFGILMLGGVIATSYQNSLRSLSLSTEDEITAIDNVSHTLRASEREAVIKSRRSAVQVMSMDINDGGISVSSGTYIQYDGKYFILTTSHGVGEGCSFTQIVVGDELYDCVQYVLRDAQTDYILIQIAAIEERNPVQLPQDAPRNNQWDDQLAAQTIIFYTGFPNEGGPYTFNGAIVGYAADEAIFIDSYGWSGSSGSGVFSGDGKLIGYIMALEVGDTHFGRQVLENFIWVIPLFNINWSAVGAFASD